MAGDETENGAIEFHASGTEGKALAVGAWSEKRGCDQSQGYSGVRAAWIGGSGGE